MDTLCDTHPGACRLAGGTAVYLPTFCADVGVDACATLTRARAAAGYVDRNRPCAMYRGRALRRTCMYVDLLDDEQSSVYTYPGFQWAATQMYRKLADEEWMRPVAEAVGRAVGDHVFTQALATRYDTGRDAIDYHRDDMQSIADPSLIFNVSLGGERVFALKCAVTGEVESVRMAHGSALVMTTACNASYLHALLPEAEPVEPRVSIIFREIKTRLDAHTLGRKRAAAACAKERRGAATRKGVSPYRGTPV
jgi:hypothetical protein